MWLVGISTAHGIDANLSECVDHFHVDKRRKTSTILRNPIDESKCCRTVC